MPMIRLILKGDRAFATGKPERLVLNRYTGLGEPDCITVPLGKGNQRRGSDESATHRDPSLAVPLTKGNRFCGLVYHWAGWGCVTLRGYGGSAARLLEDICSYTLIGLCFWLAFGGTVTVAGWFAL